MTISSTTYRGLQLLFKSHLYACPSSPVDEGTNTWTTVIDPALYPVALQPSGWVKSLGAVGEEHTGYGCSRLANYCPYKYSTSAAPQLSCSPWGGGPPRFPEVDKAEVAHWDTSPASSGTARACEADVGIMRVG